MAKFGPNTLVSVTVGNNVLKGYVESFSREMEDRFEVKGGSYQSLTSYCKYGPLKMTLRGIDGSKYDIITEEEFFIEIDD